MRVRQVFAKKNAGNNFAQVSGPSSDLPTYEEAIGNSFTPSTDAPKITSNQFSEDVKIEDITWAGRNRKLRTFSHPLNIARVSAKCLFSIYISKFQAFPLIQHLRYSKCLWFRRQKRHDGRQASVQTRTQKRRTRDSRNNDVASLVWRFCCSIGQGENRMWARKETHKNSPRLTLEPGGGPVWLTSIVCLCFYAFIVFVVHLLIWPLIRKMQSLSDLQPLCWPEELGSFELKCPLKNCENGVLSVIF